jgi:hypothetical protein
VKPFKNVVLPWSTDGPDVPPPKKPRQTKQRPEGWTNAQWATNVQRRAILNIDRRKWEAMVKAKKALSTPGAPPHYPGVWGSQGSVSSLTSLSPSSPKTFQEGHGCTPLSRFNPHGGFNPNSFVPPESQRSGFNADLNVAYEASPAHCYGPLHFAGQEGTSPSFLQ